MNRSSVTAFIVTSLLLPLLAANLTAQSPETTGTLDMRSSAIAQTPDWQPNLRIVEGEQMRAKVDEASIEFVDDRWVIKVPAANDNDFEDGVLPTGFRSWYHFEIDNLDPKGTELEIIVQNLGFRGANTPVFSINSTTDYERVPGGETVDGRDHSFSITVPPNTTFMRVAKYYPYTLSMFHAWRSDVLARPFVREDIIGNSVQGRPIHMLTITNSAIPESQKKRVWIHSSVHPSENTSHFKTEGIVEWLTSGQPLANAVLDECIFNIVPMANPDGNYLGNYRTNSQGINIERTHGYPWNDPTPEPKALRDQIVYFMGTQDNPGISPIKILLNIHSAHGRSYPFFFVHEPNWPTNGVTRSVYEAETRFVSAVRRNSRFLDMGDDGRSTLSNRDYIEAMMNDRYSLNADTWDPVVALTIEGTYDIGPIPGVPHVPDDYRELGEALGLGVADYFGVVPDLAESNWFVLN